MTASATPPPVQPLPPAAPNGKATAALVLGIISLFFNPIFVVSILGLVFGFGVRSGKNGLASAPDRTKALIGIILSAVAILIGIVGIVVVGSLIGSAGHAAAGATNALPSAESSTAVAAAPGTQAASATEAAPASPAASTKAAPEVSAVYLNALAQAEAYNQTAHLSKKALYDQLTSSYGGQFSKKAGQYAVNHIKADWKANALAQAKTYEQTAKLSPAALHDQLVSAYGGQFTESQADYAVKHVND